MAYKKTPETPESSEKTPEETAMVQPRSLADWYRDDDRFIYIGPTIPGTILKQNAVFQGRYEEITAFLSEPLERIPQIARLLVPARSLGDMALKVKRADTALHKYYTDVLAAVTANIKREG